MKLNGAGIINMYCLFKGQNTDKAMGGKGIEILGNLISVLIDGKKKI